LTKEATAAREALATLKPQAGMSQVAASVSQATSGTTKVFDTVPFFQLLSKLYKSYLLCVLF